MIYKLSSIRVILIFAFLAIYTAMVILLAITRIAPIAVIIGGLIVSAWAWYSYLTIPIEFEIISNEIVNLNSITRKIEVTLANVSQIDTGQWNRGVIVIQHSGKTTLVFRAMPGLSILLEMIKKCNPDVLVKGDKR